jgi:hypothetical protein
MKKLILLVTFALTGALQSAAADTFSVVWPSKKELKIENNHAVYEGLRHQITRVPATTCHRHVISTVQRQLLDNRKSCPPGKKGQAFTLVIDGKTQKRELCSTLLPRYQRTLESLIACSNDKSSTP